MKIQKAKSKSKLAEVIIPFTNEAAADGLFDDCPLCQELRRKMERGEVERVPSDERGGSNSQAR